MEEKELIDLTPALRTWAFKNRVKPVEFQHRMGYHSYNHAHRVVSRNGNLKFTVEAWGRFIWAFGLEAFKEVIEIANVEMKGNG